MSLFGAHITRLRIYAGLSQKQLAEMVKTGVTTIKNIECGYITAPPENLVEKLATVFGVTPYDLMNRMSFCVGEKGKMVHIVSAVSNDKPFLELGKIVETVFIDGDRFDGFDYMGIKIPDESMIGMHICPGDSVIVRKDAILKNGDVILAVWGESDGVVRKYYRNGDIVILKAENDSGLYPDAVIDVNKDRFVPIGKLITTIRSY